MNRRSRDSSRLTAAVVVIGVCLSSRAGAAPAPAPRVHVVGAGEAEPALAARLHDLLDQDLPGVVVDSAPSFRGDEPLRTDTDVTAPAAWLVLEATHARVRAAGAGRARFVFRDLEVGQPLTEFDRERMGQAVKAALGTLVSGGPGLLSRADAAAASGVILTTSPRPLVSDVAPSPSPTVTPEPRFRLGAFYQAVSVGSGLFHGPGLIATLSGSGRAFDPEIWLTAGYNLQRDFGNQLASMTVDALWMRVGLDLRLSDLIRIGAGVGIDRQTNRVTSLLPDVTIEPADDSTLITVGRLVTRAGPTRVAGIDVSLSAFLEISRAIDRIIYVDVHSGQGAAVTLYHSNNVRPGFSVELWWR